MMNNDTDPANKRPATRKCGACDQQIRTRLDLDAGEVFAAHLERGRLCPGSGNAAVAFRTLARANRLSAVS